MSLSNGDNCLNTWQSYQKRSARVVLQCVNDYANNGSSSGVNYASDIVLDSSQCSYTVGTSARPHRPTLCALFWGDDDELIANPIPTCTDLITNNLFASLQALVQSQTACPTDCQAITGPVGDKKLRLCNNMGVCGEANRTAVERVALWRSSGPVFGPMARAPLPRLSCVLLLSCYRVRRYCC